MKKARGLELRIVIAGKHPDGGDPEVPIRAGRVLVDGMVVTNPASVVRPGAAVTVRPEVRLRGSVKLAAALNAFALTVAGRVCLDVGAAAGGFTRVLLDRGASRVYAVDAGHGQLLGSLRQDPRVVNLEATNLARLDRRLVPDAVGMFTVDVSYLSLVAAVVQLENVERAEAADLVGLVKPMFELRRAAAPGEEADLNEALRRAAAGVEAAGWELMASIPSPVTGSRGAREWLLHARRCAP